MNPSDVQQVKSHLARRTASLHTDLKDLTRDLNAKDDERRRAQDALKSHTRESTAAFESLERRLVAKCHVIAVQRHEIDVLRQTVTQAKVVVSLEEAGHKVLHERLRYRCLKTLLGVAFRFYTVVFSRPTFVRTVKANSKVPRQHGAETRDRRLEASRGGGEGDGGRIT